MLNLGALAREREERERARKAAAQPAQPPVLHRAHGRQQAQGRPNPATVERSAENDKPAPVSPAAPLAAEGSAGKKRKIDADEVVVVGDSSPKASRRRPAASQAGHDDEALAESVRFAQRPAPAPKQESESGRARGSGWSGGWIGWLGSPKNPFADGDPAPGSARSSSFAGALFLPANEGASSRESVKEEEGRRTDTDGDASVALHDDGGRECQW